jgi:hypothetical protein
MRRGRQTDMQGLVLQKYGVSLWLLWTLSFEAVIVASLGRGRRRDGRLDEALRF